MASSVRGDEARRGSQQLAYNEARKTETELTEAVRVRRLLHWLSSCDQVDETWRSSAARMRIAEERFDTSPSENNEAKVTSIKKGFAQAAEIDDSKRGYGGQRQVDGEG
jgi:hypothetical protein